MTASLAYRKNEAAILAGEVPEKYTRIVPHVPGRDVLEIGSAEGVLTCLLSRVDGGAKDRVVGLEPNPDRHAAAQALYEGWRGKFRFAGVTGFANGAIADRLDLLNGMDTLVAVRMIYYLRETIDDIFAEIAKKIENVVLCGNRNRADAWRAGRPHEGLGEFNRYASLEGMRDLLMRHGYNIETEVADGDEIVVGRRFVG